MRFCPQAFCIAALLLFFPLIPAPAQAQTMELIRDSSFNSDAVSAIDHLYNLDNRAARDELYFWRVRYPDHPIWELWTGMEMWWDVLSDLHDTSHDKAFIDQMTKADYAAANLLRREPGHADALIIRAVASSYIARLHANREAWLTSLQIGRTGYQAYEQLITAMPDLADNHFAEGIKLYYSAYIPENYPLLRRVSWFLPDGDKQAGLQELDNAADEGVFTRPEATYFLAYIYLNYERETDKAITYFRRLIENYPNNGVYRRLYFRALYQMNRNSELIAAFNRTVQRDENPSLQMDPVTESEIYFWAGRAQFARGRLQDAKELFETAYRIGGNLTNADKREINILSAYFAGRVSERLQDTEEARYYYSIVSGQRTLTNVRSQARQRLRQL